MGKNGGRPSGPWAMEVASAQAEQEDDRLPAFAGAGPGLKCAKKPCPVGKEWDPSQCKCVPVGLSTCMPKPCAEGKKWDPNKCSCVCLGTSVPHDDELGVPHWWERDTDPSPGCPANSKTYFDPDRCKCVSCKEEPQAGCGYGKWWSDYWCSCQACADGPHMVVCPEGQYFDTYPPDCRCKDCADAPDGGCPNAHFWDAQRCQAMADGKALAWNVDVTEKACVACSELPDAEEKCPPATHYWDPTQPGCQCRLCYNPPKGGCPVGSHWNIELCECVDCKTKLEAECPEGWYWEADPEGCKCTPCGYAPKAGCPGHGKWNWNLCRCSCFPTEPEWAGECAGNEYLDTSASVCGCKPCSDPPADYCHHEGVYWDLDACQCSQCSKEPKAKCQAPTEWDPEDCCCGCPQTPEEILDPNKSQLNCLPRADKALKILKYLLKTYQSNLLDLFCIDLCKPEDLPLPVTVTVLSKNKWAKDDDPDHFTNAEKIIKEAESEGYDAACPIAVKNSVPTDEPIIKVCILDGNGHPMDVDLILKLKAKEGQSKESLKKCAETLWKLQSEKLFGCKPDEAPGGGLVWPKEEWHKYVNDNAVLLSPEEWMNANTQ